MAIAAATSFDLTVLSLRCPNHHSTILSAKPFIAFPKIDPRFHFPIQIDPFVRRTIYSVTDISGTPLTSYRALGAGTGDGGGGRSGFSGGGGGEGGESGRRKDAALLALAEMGRSLDSLPTDLAAGVGSGRIPVEIVVRYVEMEKSALFRWWLRVGGFKERLLADELFLAKLAMECGVGIFTKIAAEYQRRKDTFLNELEVVCADVVIGTIADFMLVYLPAPTVALRPSLAVNVASTANFFRNCPDNAFQVALGGVSYSFLHRACAIVRNGALLFAVGAASSLVGTTITNACMNVKNVIKTSTVEEVTNLPIVSTSLAYGAYMAVSSNLRYQIVAGVVEQRILEPLLHNHKLMLSTMCFAIRTGNTFLGSLLWVDYARWVGIQKNHDG